MRDCSNNAITKSNVRRSKISLYVLGRMNHADDRKFPWPIVKASAKAAAPHHSRYAA